MLTTVVGCSSKPCPKLYSAFVIYDKPKPVKFKGSTKADCIRDLRTAVVKLRTQDAIIKAYENDINRYNAYRGAK